MGSQVYGYPLWYDGSAEAGVSRGITGDAFEVQ
jgi:hypothetical protein